MPTQHIENVGIAPQLRLQPAGAVQDAPEVLRFERPREVALPWAQLAAATHTDADDAKEAAAQSLLAYFEESWGVTTGVARSKAEITMLLDREYLVTQPGPDTTGPGPFVPLHDTALFPAGEGVFAQHSSGRWYRLLVEPDSAAELVIQSFATPKGYAAAWDSVVGIELVGDTAAGADASATTEVRRIDLRAPFIESRYKELIVQRDIAASRFQLAASGFQALHDEDAPWDSHTIDARTETYRSAARELDQIEQTLKRLSRQASEMGYVLFIEPVRPRAGDSEEPPAAVAAPSIMKRSIDADGNLGDPAPGNADYGRLYRRSVEFRSYTPTQTVFAVVGWLFPRVSKRVVKLPPVTTSTEVHVEVDTLREPHIERIAELGESASVHVCELTESGYYNQDGLPLELVMLQCASDETVRMNTVVLIPDYDYRLTGERVLTGYTEFHRPVAGASPSAFPQLSILESLVYRTAWCQTEVGELVKSINLAPGERREVTVTRTFEQETTTTSTSSSVFDLASSESSDLSSEMEKTARNETDLVDKMSATASASVTGSGVGVSGTASASGSAGRDKSVKDVGTDLAKSAQKAARSLNESRKEEVSSTSTSTDRSSTSDTSVSIIENINQGRTLNLFFYRLYNRFIGKLFLTDLRLNVRGGTEVIAGSGIYPERTFSVHDLGEAVSALAKTPLPISGSDQQTAELQLAILREIAGLFQSEYAALAPDAGGNDTSVMLGSGESTGSEASVVRFGDGLPEIGERLAAMPLLVPQASADGTPDAAAAFQELLDELETALAGMEIGGLPVNTTELLVAASGVYMDSQVGNNPATEPYSELMRDAEIEMRHAEIDRVRSETARNDALARRVALELPPNDREHVDIRLDGQRLAIELPRRLGDGDWCLEHGDKPVRGTLVPITASTVVHDFGGAVPSWVADQDFRDASLYDRAKGTRIALSSSVS